LNVDGSQGLQILDIGVTPIDGSKIPLIRSAVGKVSLKAAPMVRVARRLPVAMFKHDEMPELLKAGAQ
jgi:DNA-binding IclR family transcriptional regulator